MAVLKTGLKKIIEARALLGQQVEAEDILGIIEIINFNASNLDKAHKRISELEKIVANLPCCREPQEVKVKLALVH